MRWMLPLAVMAMLFTVIKSAVIGIDFGSNFYKISLIAPGKSFVIVESMSSKRKVANALSYVQNKRQYDSDAVGKKVRFPSNTFTFVNKFLGALENNEEVFEISKEYYEEFVTSFDRRGYVQFELKNFQFDGYDDEDETLVLRVEVVVAQILKYGKMLADKMGKTDIKDCVITVPSHWGLAQRDALLTAAEIAGLHTLNLISENTAAGLYYGVERMDTNSTHTVLFYNIGSTNLQTSLIEYSAVEQQKSLAKNNTKTVESVNVLADYGVSNVGGLAYDKVIADFFAEQIDKKPDRQGKPSIKENKRVMRKLLKETTRTKEILSANKDAMYYSEGLYDGNDFSGQITRQEFEERSKDLLSHLTYPIDETLKRANKTIDDIDAVELLGGGIRIPIIQQILKEHLGDKLELGQHMNGDEAMALGASFNGANYSHSFRVRDVLLSDGYNFEVKAAIKNLNESITEGDEGYYSKQFSLFPYKKRFGTKKSVTLTNKQNLQIDLTTTDYDGVEVPYAQFNLTNIDKIQKDKFYNETVKPKVHLEFEISSTEGITLNEAVVKFNYTAREKVPEKEAKALLRQQEKQTEKNKKEAIKKATEEAKKLAEEKGESTENIEIDPSTVTYEEGKLKADIHVTYDTDGETGKQEKILYRIKHKQKNMDVDIKETYFHYTPLNRTEFKKSQRLVKRFDLYEERQRNLSDTKNKFETFVYQVRDWVDDEYFMKFIKEDDLQKLKDQRDNDQEWLDTDEAFHGNITVYQDRLKGLEDLSYPTLRRIEEYRLRPEYINKTAEEIQNFQKKLGLLEKDHKWLNETDLEPFKTLLNETIEWVKSNLDKQREIPQNEDPAFSVYELKPKLEELNRVYQNVKAIKEPKKESDKKEKKAKKPKMPKKQTIKIDGEDVEIDFEELKKQQEFKNFDFEKFQENLKKQEEQKKKEEAKNQKEQAEQADHEEENIEEDNNENEEVKDDL